VANTEKNLANARELFDSYLNSVFTQKGEGWVNTTVSDLVDKKILAKPRDGNHGGIHPKKADFVKTGVPFIMASDLINGDVDQAHCNFISKGQADNLQKGFAEDEDVLLSHKGTIGRVAVLKTQHDYVMLTPQVSYYRIVDQDILNNRYLYYFFQSPAFQREMGQIAGAGSTRAYIGITKQLDLHISYPPLNDQIQFSKAFDTLTNATQRLETLYQQKLQALAELKQSILQKAFNGNLTSETIKKRA
jgi:type I restriction enzyme, S subunit